MFENAFDWLVLLTRWLHITAAISWIGSSFFFNWLDLRLKAKDAEAKAKGVRELWMVHGGGFYHINKLPFGMTQVPAALHWVKWEAAWTWISGALLLLLVYYSGGGVVLIDSDIADLTFLQAAAVGIGTVLIASAIYDILWESPLARKPGLAHALTILLACGAAYWLCAKLSGRAAYIHTGAVLGTWMVANVWMRIIPGQAKSLAAVEAGEVVDPKWASNAKNRSVHNNYFTLPVIFIMLSNHFPATYGHDLNWLILILLGLAGASIRHFFNLRATAGNPWWPLVPGFVCLVIVVVMTGGPVGNGNQPDKAVNAAIEAPDAVTEIVPPIDPATAGTIAGTVHFDGPVKKRRTLRLPAECEHHVGEPVLEQSFVVNGGKLQNAFVWIAKGLEGYQFPVPSEEVEIDQKGCIYTPHFVGAQVGQKVTFINSDPVLHNVKSLSEKNRRFNRAMPKQGSRMTQMFDRPEIAVPVKCSLHPWMGAYIGVVPHPYHAVTDAQGNFRLENVPPGDYEIGVWHQATGERRRTVTVTNQGNLQMTFRLEREK